MKAAIYTNYGPPEIIRIEDIEKPVPNAHEVLVQVHCATLNRTDTGYRSAKYFVSRLFTGLIHPKRPVAGSEFAGKIVEIGAGVTQFSIGDKVFGFEDIRSGAHAEFMAVAENGSIAKMPKNRTYQELAPAGEGATYALSVIKDAGLGENSKVLVYGASGAIGSAAVQILKHLGSEVTAVCGTKNLKLIKSLGADKIIDYQKEDFTDTDTRYDFIFDAVGKSSYGTCKKLLTPQGSYYSTELGKGAQNIFLALWFWVTGSRKLIFPIPKINQETMENIRRLIEINAFRPLVDRMYTLDEIVEATKYVETGQKVGNVVIKIR